MRWYSAQILPKLYPDGDVPCPICSSHADTNQHLGLLLHSFTKTEWLSHHCPLQIGNAYLTISQYSSSDNIVLHFLTQDLNALDLFLPIHGPNHAIYLILHQLVPTSLTDFIHQYTGKFSSTKAVHYFWIYDFLSFTVISWYLAHPRTRPEWLGTYA